MPYRWASSKVSEDLAARMCSVKSWITFSLKTNTTVFFEKSVPNNRHGLVCQENVIFTSIAVKTSIFALFYSVVYFFSVFIIKLYIPSFIFPSFFNFVTFISHYAVLRFYWYIPFI
jgi:hypothetical protein